MMLLYTVPICLFHLISSINCSDEAKGDKIERVDCSTLRIGQYICPDPSLNQIDPVTQQFRGCQPGKNIPSEGEAEVQCIAADGIICNSTQNSTFRRKLPCKYTALGPLIWKYKRIAKFHMSIGTDSAVPDVALGNLQQPEKPASLLGQPGMAGIRGKITYNGPIKNGYSLEIALLLSVFLGMFGLDRFYLGYPGIGLAKLCTLGFMFLGQLLDIILIAAQVVGPADGSAYVIPYFGAGVTIVRSTNETYLLPQADWHNIT